MVGKNQIGIKDLKKSVPYIGELKIRKRVQNERNNSRTAEKTGIINFVYELIYGGQISFDNNREEDIKATEGYLAHVRGRELSGIGLEKDVVRAWENPRSDAFLLNNNYAIPVEVKMRGGVDVLERGLRQLAWTAVYLRLQQKKVPFGVIITNFPRKKHMTAYVRNLSLIRKANTLGLTMPQRFNDRWDENKEKILTLPEIGAKRLEMIREAFSDPYNLEKRLERSRWFSDYHRQSKN